MKIALALTALAIGVLSVFPAVGAEDPPRAFACEFKSGASWTYEAGSFQSKAPSPLAFDIESIDLEGQSAVLKTGPALAAGPLRIIRAINANHFLEVVNEGFLNLTTVYDKDPATGTYPAVHSRHFGILGQPVFSQYVGTCRAK